MRTQLALGTALVGTTVALSFAINGVATSQIPGNPLPMPVAAATELEPFTDCADLLSWYVEEARDEVGPWGLGGGWGYPMPLAAMSDAGGAERDMAVETRAAYDAVESEESGTNVQEAGVDEPDLAKTNGDVVVHLRGRTLVVTDVRGDTPREVGTLRLARELGDAELLLSGDTVLVLGQTWGHHGWAARSALVDSPYPGGGGSTRVVEVSIADPAAPTIESDGEMSAELLSARLHDGTVRMVLRSGAPTIDWVHPDRRRTRKEAKAENLRLLEASAIEDWVPTVVGPGGTDEQPLVECGDVLHPDEGSGWSTTAIVSFPIDSPDDRQGAGLTADGSVVYSSTDRLYLTSSRSGKRTQVHAFALDGTDTAYVASGSVAGRVKDRWSLDEQDGLLRVAASYGGWSPDENGIEILRERDGRLESVGSVRGLGPDEEIKSVRWFEDLAVVVTFRQTDPLYTVDLSDPARPRTLGELKIEGFSAYLHPIGGDLLLGVGYDATKRGRVTGGQASVFDLGDLAAPRRTDVVSLGRDLEPVVTWDTRAFTWLADSRTALTPLVRWRGGSELVALTVAPDGTLVQSDAWDLANRDVYGARTLPLDQGRVALVADGVRLLDLS